jgi:hypothetical protein
MSLFNTVFAKNLQLHQMEMQRLQQQQAQQEEQRRYQDTQIAAQLARADQRKDKEFERQFKVAELQGKYLGMLGQATPKFTDPALQEMGETAYLGGMADTGMKLGEWQHKLDIEEMQQGGANQRNLRSNQTRRNIADQTLGQKQVFHDENMFWKEQDFNQDQSQHLDKMALGWARLKQGGGPGQLSPQEEREYRRYATLLGKDMRSFVPMRENAKVLKGLLASPNPDAAIAGTGPLVGYVPKFMLSTTGTLNRSALSGFLSTILHDQSGATVTSQEMARQLQSTLLDQNARPDQIRLGIDKLLKALDADMRAVEASYPAEAVEIYRQRPGMVNPDNFLGDDEGIPDW